MIPIKCYTCSCILSCKKVLDSIQKYKGTDSMIPIEQVLNEMKQELPLNYCCNIKLISAINDDN